MTRLLTRPGRLALACGGSFIGTLDATVTNLAVPALVSDFDASVTTVSWVVTAYAVLMAALLAPGGAIADFVGRERLFTVGVTTFSLASLAAALSPTIEVLIAARAAQGAGAALLVPASLAFVLADTPPDRRPAAIGLWSALAAVAAAVGPTLGGITVDVTSWRWVFLINIPVGLWLYLGARHLTRTELRSDRSPDAVGAVSFALSVGALVLSITQGEDWGWSSAPVLGGVAASVVFGAVAVRRSATHSTPALEISLWRSRVYAAANGISFLFGAALYIVLIVGVVFLVDVWGYSPLEAGLAVTPGAITATAVGLVVGRLARRPSPSTLVAVGASLIAGVGLVLGLTLGSDPRLWDLWVPTGLVLGVGVGAASVGVTTAAAMSVPPLKFATATGLNVAARQVGGAVGVATFAAIIAAQPGDGPTDAFRTVYGVITLASVAILPITPLLRPRPAPTAPAPPVGVAEGSAA
ncbi:MAG TPA: MFS transporter [Nocardioides sp.]|nr:MFS transporter [Nocardioides sp.]